MTRIKTKLKQVFFAASSRPFQIEKKDTGKIRDFQEKTLVTKNLLAPVDSSDYKQKMLGPWCWVLGAGSWLCSLSP
jgi:hypothetical protein